MSRLTEPTRGSGRDGLLPVVGALCVAYVAVMLAGLKRTLLPDEIRPLLVAAESPARLLALARDDIVQTPGSYFLARVWLDVFGHTDLAAKLLPIVIGVATIVLFAVLVRRIMPEWRIATVVLTLVYLRVGSSPNLVRMYGLLVLLAVAALLALDAWRRRPGPGPLVAWAAAMIAALYTHPSALLLLGSTTVAVWVLGPGRLRFTLAPLAAMMAFVPWVASVVPVYRSRGLGANIAGLEANPTREVARLPFFFLTGEPPGGSSPLERVYDLGTPGWWRWLALLLFASLIACAVPAIARSIRSPREARGVADYWLGGSALIAGLPVVVLYIASLASQPVLSARYLFSVLPATILLVVELARRGGRAGRLVLGSMLVWIAISAVWAFRLNARPAPARIVAEQLAERLQPDDAIFVGHHGGIGFQFAWEWTRRLGRTEPFHILPTEQAPWLADIIPAEEIADIDLTGKRRIWYIGTRRAVRENAESEILARGFVPADTVPPALYPYVREE